MLQPGSPVSPEVVQQASSSLIKDSALGAFALICLTLAVWAIMQLKKTQDQRVDDKERLTDKLEAANEKDRAAQGQFSTAVGQLATALQENTRATERHTRTVDDLSRAVDGIIRDAIGVRRRTGSSGSIPAVRSPSSSPREGGE